ncbi:MAG: ATP-binding protein [Candidatus Pacebacteria bacterium]|jgi:predicted AAA+ superfamily ATPase|nr:ATP-binding protein [Candidatus Paceibacterota bacterium]
MEIIKRKLQKHIEEKLFKGKVIILLGARQVGKTTLVKEILKDKDYLFLNCDEPDIRKALSNRTSTELKSLIRDHKLVFIDEAQRVTNIGLTLKLLNDTFKDIQIIIAGSSSFELANEIEEPLTGRAYEFFLPPLSFQELSSKYSLIELKRIVEKRIIFGMYPEVVLKDDQDLLRNIQKNYLYKDILKHDNIRKPELLEKLLQALALQIGSEVSYNELSKLLDVDKTTVQNYISILEKAFIVFKLKPYCMNKGIELRKLRKIYFYDTGIRNALINNFNSLDLRNDKGALWENFLISERIKRNINQNKHINHYFWRTYAQKEIDYLEEINNVLFGYEFKFSLKKKSSSKPLKALYKDASYTVINKNNFLDFILDQKELKQLSLY